MSSSGSLDTIANTASDYSAGLTRTTIFRVRHGASGIYDDAVREAVIVIREAADRIRGKCLKAAMPHVERSMERHGHLDLGTL